jgi:hypothetical protein
LAWCVRIAVLVTPIAGSFAFVHYASYWVRPPATSLALYLLWWFGLSASATVVLFVIDRVVRRLLPLAALLRLSLIFPDETPSRFKLALRAGNVESLEKRLALVREARNAKTPREAAARLLQLVAALNVHDLLTRGHSERVRAYSRLIGKELRLGQHDLDRLNWAALLHDIGKLEVPQSILTKPGRPSEDEWQLLRQHPLFGEELTAPLSAWLGTWRDAVGYHHERWDGKGYPRGLAADEIPLAGRIVAVADVFDVITSARSYKAAGNSVEGRHEIARCAGTQFDPRVVRAFLNVSLGRMRLIMGPLSWLSHAPFLGRIPLTPGLAALASTATVVAGVAATGALAGPATTLATARLRPISSYQAGPPTPKPRERRPIRPRRGTTHAAIRAAIPSGSAAPLFFASSSPPIAPQPSSPTSRSSTPPTAAAQPSSSSAPPAGSAPSPGPSSPPSRKPPHKPAPRPPRSPTPTPPRTPPTSTPTPSPPSPAPSPPPTPPPPPPAATKLTFTTQPTATNAGAAVSIAVSVQNASSATVTSDNTTSVKLSFASSPPGASLACVNPGGSGPETVVAGVARFTCSFNRSGSYQLAASDTSSPGGGHPYTAGTSTTFTIAPGPATALAFTTEPTSTSAGAPISPAVQVSVTDAYGNLVSSDNSTAVTLAIGTNPNAGTLSGTTTQTVSSGTATFANLSITAAGSGYTLTASSNATLTTATSSPFNVTAAMVVGATLLTGNSGSPCTSGPSCTTASISAPAGTTLLILAQRGGSTTTTDSVTSITGPFSATSSVNSVEYPLASNRDYLFAWTATANGSSGSVTVNFASGSNANPTVIDVIKLSGNNTSTPVAQQTTGSSQTGTATATLASPNGANGEVVLVSYLANATLTTPAGFTALDTIQTGSNGGENYGLYFNSSAQASTSISSSSLGNGWGTIAIEINHG